MSLYTIIFSPTGTTKKVADTLASAMAEHHTEIDLSDNNRSFSRTAFTDEIYVFWRFLFTAGVSPAPPPAD